MTDQLHRTLARLHREVSALYFVLLLMALVVVTRIGFLLYKAEVEEIWPLLPPLIALLAAVLVSRTANRVIVHADSVRMDDRKRAIVQTTHHLIAITQDLESRVNYARKIFEEGGRPAIALVKIAESIESRYETLLQRDAYTYLPGNLVDIIAKMSGTIYGLSTLAAGIDKTLGGAAAAAAKMPAGRDTPIVAQLDGTLKEISKLIDGLFELRYSVDGKKHERKTAHGASET